MINCKEILNKIINASEWVVSIYNRLQMYVENL